MLPIEHYYVRINSSKCDVITEPTINEAILICEEMDELNITYTVNITVVNINGQRSDSTVTEKTVQNTKPGKHNCDTYVRMWHKVYS